MGVIRVRALIRAPLPQVWGFLLEPENMHLWGPPTRPLTGFNRPFQEGDRVTFDRRDFFRTHRQFLLVEKVVPYHSLHLRDLSPPAAKLNVRVALSVEEGKDREGTWVEEAIFYSFGSSRVSQSLDCALINPVLQLLGASRTNEAFRRLQAILEKPQTDVGSASGTEEHKGT